MSSIGRERRTNPVAEGLRNAMRLAMLEDDRDQSSTVEAWLRDAGHDVHAVRIRAT